MEITPIFRSHLPSQVCQQSHQDGFSLKLSRKCAVGLHHVGARQKRQRAKEKKYGVLLDGLTHIQAHLHTVPGVMRQRLGQTGHAVVAVPQDLDPHALVLLQKWVRGSREGGEKKVTSDEIPFGTLNCFIDKTLAVRYLSPPAQSHPPIPPPFNKK